MRKMAAAQLKSQRLAVMDEVSEGGQSSSPSDLASAGAAKAFKERQLYIVHARRSGAQ